MSKGFIWLLGIGIAVIAIGMLMLVFTSVGQQQLPVGNVIEGEGGTSITCPDSTTTVTFPVKDFYSQSTSVSATPYGRIGDSGITNLTGQTLGIGAEITDLFYSASNYLDAKADSFIVACGMTQAPVVTLKPTDSPDTFYVANRAGTQLTDSASSGANNATATSGTLELELVIGATTKESTGDLVVVVEYDNTTQADDISLSNSEDYTPISGNLDDIYSEESSSASIVRAFKIDAVEDGDTMEYALKVFPETGQTLESTAVRTTIMSIQAFEDTDGSVVEGVANSDGTTKYEDTSDYDVMVAASA